MISFYVDDDGAAANAKEWEAEFERETGKTIIDGGVHLKDPLASIAKARADFAMASGKYPTRLRCSLGLVRRIVEAELGRRAYGDWRKSDGLQRLRLLGLDVEIDNTVPPETVVVD